MPASLDRPERRHDIDALRVIAFGLLILYHCAMAYVAGWGWHVKSTHTAEWLQWPMLLLNRWRMPLLFLISGIAFSFLLRKGEPLRLAGQRTIRLLLPLLFGIAVVVPIQPYCQGVSNGKVAPGFFDFLLRYYGGGPWPKDAFDGWQYGFTWNHLWYLSYAWAYTMIVLVMLPLLSSASGQRFCARLRRARGAWLLVLPALPKALAMISLADRFDSTNAFFNDWYQHAFYFVYFFYGWLLAGDTGLWNELRRLRRVTLGLALLCYAGYAPLILLLGDDIPKGWPLDLIRLISGLNTWLWIATVLGWSYALLNRPMAWVRYGNDAVFPWYVLHQSLIVAAVFWLKPLGLGPIVEPLLVLSITVGGCFIGYEVVRRIGWLRPLFGMRSARLEAGNNATALPA